MAQCDAWITAGDGTRFYCVKQRDHDGPHEADQTATKARLTWESPTQKTASAKEGP